MVSLAGWLAPSVMVVLGVKASMIAGSICFILFAVSYFYLNEVLLYVASAVMGCGGSLVWAAEVPRVHFK